MPFEPFTAEWAQVYKEKLNQNPQYRQAAKTWEGPVVFQVEKDPAIGLEEDRAVFLDLSQGECRDARVATEEDLQAAEVIISGDTQTWKQVFDRKLEPISTLMRGRLKLVKGNMSVLSAYVMASKQLLASALEVDTEIPEGLD
ncbi:MAG: SCP2 sterol-binding domain-containing protein [Firmicutes bacterium]|uniref:Putative sterol carrier protein n=1 Tax=Melghirimyces thermohalophilus TaxID=1236220 RepID=A0A1G6I7B3_9BACL|nr:SCP2 sterol-binding domain-containing protein [Melghirimyces thermohalophilus]MDA8353211.1 SCP2 sterol-binding domain-containing protein [Bacillota bacterium]SDC01646.1 Putative sterol carrier protein [Melghirimyces thermohalophilus]